MQKLMTAGIVLALVISIYNSATVTKVQGLMSRVLEVSSRSEERANEVYWNQAILSNWMTNYVLPSNTNSLFSLHRAFLNDTYDELVSETRKREALQKFVESNDERYMRLIAETHRDGDKMYTNIVMFGASVFDLRNEVAVACARIQELEESKGRVSGGGKPLVPGVLPIVPTDAAPEGAPPEWDNPVKKREKERLALENAGSK